MRTLVYKLNVPEGWNEKKEQGRKSFLFNRRSRWGGGKKIRSPFTNKFFEDDSSSIAGPSQVILYYHFGCKFAIFRCFQVPHTHSLIARETVRSRREPFGVRKITSKDKKARHTICKKKKKNLPKLYLVCGTLLWQYKIWVGYARFRFSHKRDNYNINVRTREGRILMWKKKTTSEFLELLLKTLTDRRPLSRRYICAFRSTIRWENPPHRRRIFSHYEKTNSPSFRTPSASEPYLRPLYARLASSARRFFINANSKRK